MLRVLSKKSNIALLTILAVLIGTVMVITALNPALFALANKSQSEEYAPDLGYFSIRVIDSATGRGIPMAVLETSNANKFYTDSNGYIAFYEPGLMDQEVWFYVSAQGYRYPREVFGMVGSSVRVKPGGSAVFEMERTMAAERLYRVTGQGIYTDTLALGQNVPTSPSSRSVDITGVKSAMSIEYKGEIYWFWGDARTADKDFGDLGPVGAVSKLPSTGGLDPDTAVDLEYFTDDNDKLKSVFPKKQGDPQYSTINGLMVVKDSNGADKLVAGYTLMDKNNNPVETGIAIFNDAKKEFDQRVVLESNNGAKLDDTWRTIWTNTVKYEDNGKEYYLLSKDYPDAFPVLRVRATLDAVSKLSEYEAFTPMKNGSTKSDITSMLSKLTDIKQKGTLGNYLDLDSKGNPVWSWKKNTAPITQDNEKRLISRDLIKADQAKLQLKTDQGKELVLENGSVRWNEYRKKWILIGTQRNGDSFLGEVWYAEASSPTGPWTTAKKVVTHDNYTFNNIVQHPYFDKGNGRYVYFTGNYTAEFTSNHNRVHTPKYESNQIMYKLDLNRVR